MARQPPAAGRRPIRYPSSWSPRDPHIIAATHVILAVASERRAADAARRPSLLRGTAPRSPPGAAGAGLGIGSGDPRRPGRAPATGGDPLQPPDEGQTFELLQESHADPELAGRDLGVGAPIGGEDGDSSPVDDAVQGEDITSRQPPWSAASTPNASAPTPPRRSRTRSDPVRPREPARPIGTGPNGPHQATRRRRSSTRGGRRRGRPASTLRFGRDDAHARTLPDADRLDGLFDGGGLRYQVVYGDAWPRRPPPAPAARGSASRGSSSRNS